VKRISPIQQAIATIDDTVRRLRLQRAELMALLPMAKPARRPEIMTLTLSNGRKISNTKRRIIQHGK